MYEFVRGPMMLISFSIFVLGLSYQVFQLFKITRKKRLKEYPRKTKKVKFLKRIIISFKNIITFNWINKISLSIKDTVLGNQPYITLLSITFHVCLMITPIFLVAHNILFLQSWGFSFFTFSELTTDIMTIIFLISAFIFLLRRILIKKVRIVSSLYDYLLLIITTLPFLTGFLSYHQFLNSEMIMLIHILSGELMLITVGLTKLGHMVFFFFVRFNIGSEFSFRSGSRSW